MTDVIDPPGRRLESAQLQSAVERLRLMLMILGLWPGDRVIELERIYLKALKSAQDRQNREIGTMRVLDEYLTEESIAGVANALTRAGLHVEADPTNRYIVVHLAQPGLDIALRMYDAVSPFEFTCTSWPPPHTEVVLALTALSGQELNDAPPEAIRAAFDLLIKRGSLTVGRASQLLEAALPPVLVTRALGGTK